MTPCSFTPAEFAMPLEFVDERYKVFNKVMVLAGDRFGEGMTATVADVNLSSGPALVRIMTAWKPDGATGAM